MPTTLGIDRIVTQQAGVEMVPMADFGGSPGMFNWHNLPFDPVSGSGSYLLEMCPGAASTPHRHKGREEFYVISGELVDCDGQVYRAGDFVSLAPGTAHTSISLIGCRLLVTAWGPPEQVTPGELEPMS